MKKKLDKKETYKIDLEYFLILLSQNCNPSFDWSQRINYIKRSVNIFNKKYPLHMMCNIEFNEAICSLHALEDYSKEAKLKIHKEWKLLGREYKHKFEANPNGWDSSMLIDPIKYIPPKKIVRKRSLTLNYIIKQNTNRALAWHKEGLISHNWTLSDWSNAVAGEIGEACNIVKKIRRIQLGIEQKRNKEQLNIESLKKKLGEEIADSFLYLILLSKASDIDFEKCVIDKFNEVSIAEDFEQRL